MSVSNLDIVSVVIQASLDDGTICQNRKRFRLESAVTKTDGEILNAVKTWVDTLYAFVASQIATTTELEDGTVDVIDWNGGTSSWETIQNVGVYSPLDSFALGTEVLPNQCSAFAIGNTTRPKSKGRIFCLPFGETMQAGGILTAPALAAMVLFAGQYIFDQAVGGDSLVSGIVRETADLWLPFLTAEVSDVIGTQRRRRRGVGT